MIDIDSLQVYVESAREHGFMSENCGMTYLQADELFERLRQAEKDAARYRWLRDRSFKNDILSLLASHPSEWDELVDDARISEERQ